jgi:hypothetical protein
LPSQHAGLRMIENRSETLRRRVEFYRRCLGQSLGTELERVFLLEIGEAQLELEELEKERAGGTQTFKHPHRLSQ